MNEAGVSRCCKNCACTWPLGLDFPGLWGPLCCGDSLWRVIIDKGFGKASGSQVTCAMETQPGQLRPKQSLGPILNSSRLHLYVRDLETHTGLKESHSAMRARAGSFSQPVALAHFIIFGPALWRVLSCNWVENILLLPHRKNACSLQTWNMVEEYKEMYITHFNLLTWQW